MNAALYRPDIDGLRAIAVISVVLYHVGFGVFPGGFVGVDIFFVISGFLITRLIVNELEQKGTFKFGNFYLRRARRLFPAMFATLFASAFIATILFSPTHLERFGGALIHAVASISNFYFWVEADYFDVSSKVKPLLHTWSLGVEEQFYLIWPATLVLLSQRLPRYVLPIGLVLMAVTSLFLNYVFADGQVASIDRLQSHLPGWLALQDWFSEGQATIFYLLPFRVFEFSIGAALLWIMRLGESPNIVKELCVAIGLSLITYAVVFFNENMLFPGSAALIPCLGAALCIYGGQAKYLGHLLSNPLCVGAGLISYSLYLVHWPLIVFWQYYTFQSLILWEQLAIIALSFVIATFMYRYIEQPFRKPKITVSAAIQTPTQDNGTFGVGIFALTLLLVVPANWMTNNNGWEWRIDNVTPAELIPPDVKKVNIKNIDRETKWTYAYQIGNHKNEQTSRVLVLGDSHAMQLLGGAKYLSAKYNVSFTFYTFIGCPPIFGTYKVYGAPKGIIDESQKQIGCREQTQKWEEYVHSNQFDYVILSSRWNWLFEPTEYFDTKQRRDLLIDKEDPMFTETRSRKVFSSFLGSTIESIHESGATAIIFGQVPHVGKNLEGCNNIPKFLYSNEEINSRCNHVPKSYILERNEFSDNTIRNVAAKNDAISVIPSEIFCNENTRFCRTIYNGVRLKNDADHINASGAIYLAMRWENTDKFPFTRL